MKLVHFGLFKSPYLVGFFWLRLGIFGGINPLLTFHGLKDIVCCKMLLHIQPLYHKTFPIVHEPRKQKVY